MIFYYLSLHSNVWEGHWGRWMRFCCSICGKRSIFKKDDIWLIHSFIDQGIRTEEKRESVFDWSQSSHSHMPSQCFRQSVVITANGVVGGRGCVDGVLGNGEPNHQSQVMKGFFELLGFGSFMIDVSSWSICFILPLAFLLLFRTWRVRTAARRRGRSSLFRFAFVLLYFPIIWLKLLFLFDTGWGGGWGRGRRGSTPSSSFSK